MCGEGALVDMARALAPAASSEAPQSDVLALPRVAPQHREAPPANTPLLGPYESAELAALRAFRAQILPVFSHDIKSPLSALSMNIDYLAGELGASHPGTELMTALGECRTALSRAFRIVADVLDVARAEGGALIPFIAPCSPREIVSRTAAAYSGEAAARKIELRQAWAGEPVADADEALLERALSNLLDHVLRRTQPGDTVLLRATTTREAVELAILSTVAYERLDFSPEATKPSEDAVARGAFAMRFCHLVADAHAGVLEAFVEGDWPSCVRLVVPRS
jgi:two-component system sensor histidine kinase KdpD